jgi:hypothetical protein
LNRWYDQTNQKRNGVHLVFGVLTCHDGLLTDQALLFWLSIIH